MSHYWTQKNGVKIRICDMTNGHLQNSYAMLVNKGFCTKDDFELALGSAASMQGEMASMYAEQEVAAMKVFPGMEHLEEELVKRGLATRK